MTVKDISGVDFSVVIPLFNKSYSIRRAVDSVISQKHPCKELIIVNDGSTDDSAEIVELEFQREIEKGLIKLIFQQNAGVSAARNKGISESGNDFICFLDADDEWNEDHLEKIYQLISDFPNADLYCTTFMKSISGRSSVVGSNALPLGFRGYVPDFFKWSTKGSVAKSSVACVRKSALTRIGGFPAGIVAGEDLITWILLALNGGVVAERAHTVTVYIEDDQSRSSRSLSVPYPLVYFAGNKSFKTTRSLNGYLFMIFAKHFIASLRSRKYKEAWLRFRWYVRTLI